MNVYELQIILNTGVPNYAQARIPLASGLNINEWERELRNYHDPFVLQYIASQFPAAVRGYLEKESALGAMMGPLGRVNSDQFHCSLLLTRPKDKDKQRVILNLSHPHGGSVNDHVVKDHFVGRKFTLRSPTIDDMFRKYLMSKVILWFRKLM